MNAIREVQQAKFTISIKTKNAENILRDLLEIGKGVGINVQKTSATFNPITKSTKIKFTFLVKDFEMFTQKLKKIVKL